MTKPSSLVDRFDAFLRGHASASHALEQWHRHSLEGGAPSLEAPQLQARPIRPCSELASPPADALAVLALAAGESLRARHVALSLGGDVVSIAANWYVPERLDPAMNAALADGTTPFGKIIGPLHFDRELLESSRDPGAPYPKGTILRHRAVLRLRDGRALAYLVECYTRANLAVPATD